ncbi:hypothetical protein [Phenylobacterium sp.]|uniref:hypothetical protein n=1 Tax=Phenylobacterium sp. TaxID=1871053 RepID=UPI00273354F4|nr:hypothetical protein [Phenylobacterium sp.]MDP3854575.1 hypothetical protein [Phenylobacterium sp.]
MADPDRSGERAAVSRVLRLRQEVAAFERRWPEPRTEQPMAPAFSWTQLERQLADLVDTPAKQAMARELVSATRKMARFKPPEMVLREILCLSWALLDESFQPGSGEGSVEMT